MCLLIFVGQILAFVARVILFVAGFLILISLMELIPLALSVASTHINLFSLGLLTLVIYQTTLAIYGIRVSLFPCHSFKRSAYTAPITFIICLAAFVSFTQHVDRFENASLTGLRELQADYNWAARHVDNPIDKPKSKEATAVWDLVQESLDCCGFESPSDWAPFKPADKRNEPVLPISCCRDVLASKSPQTDGLCSLTESHWSHGCSHKIRYVLALIGSSLYYGLVLSLLINLLLLYKSLDCTDEAPPTYASSTRSLPIEYVHPPATVRTRLLVDGGVVYHCYQLDHNNELSGKLA